ncbi:MAG: hypothetical protein V9E96_14690 [Chitinophagaceae bacterium]
MDRYKIHDIEVVIDRLAVSNDMKVRISQSVQQTLKMGKDLMFLLINDSNTVVQYSKQLMCIETGISYEEPSPNAFSFNSPYGACPVCKGLGNVYAIDINTVVPDYAKTVNEGGIVPLGEERDASVFQQVKAFSKKNKISLDKPLKNLTTEQINLLLYGDQSISSSLELDMNDENIPNEYTGSYEGIIPMLKRWFTSTQSNEGLKSWVEKFMELSTCTTCNGARLRTRKFVV